MRRTRDDRDPTKLGEAYMTMRKGGASIAEAVHASVSQYASNETPLERYGDPREYEVVVETTIRRIPRAAQEPDTGVA